METAFYLALPEMAQRFKELLAKDDAVRRKATKLAKSLGARAAYWSTRMWSGREVSGFAFAAPPGKRFVKLKGTSDGWRPRVSKENEQLIKEMEALTTLGTQDIGAIVGLESGHLRFDGMGVRMSGGAGLTVVGDQFIVEVDKRDGEPKGCVRISDVERERLIAEAENAKPKKRRLQNSAQ